MGRRFSTLTTLGGHNKSYAVRPNKTLITAMGWKKGDSLEVFPIPERGIVCLKGKTISKKAFERNFEEGYMLNNRRTELRKVIKRLKSLKNKSTPLDWVFEEGRQELKDLIKEIERWESKLDSFDKMMSSRQSSLYVAIDNLNTNLNEH